VIETIHPYNNRRGEHYLTPCLPIKRSGPITNYVLLFSVCGSVIFHLTGYRFSNVIVIIKETVPQGTDTLDVTVSVMGRNLFSSSRIIILNGLNYCPTPFSSWIVPSTQTATFRLSSSANKTLPRRVYYRRPEVLHP
jgi:hypothetical protein